MSTRLVVEWTRASLRMAVAAGGEGRCRLQAIHAQPLGSGEVGAALRRFLSSVKLSPDQVVSVVPREIVITRVVRFPATDPAELSKMIELYAKAQLPYPREHTVMDFQTIAQADGFSTVALVACQRETIDRHLAVLQEAGVAAGIVTVSAWGVWGWHVARRGGGLAQGAEAEPVLVVNVDDVRTDLVLIEAQRLLSSRSVGQGALDWPSGTDVAEVLAGEVERTRAALRKELPAAEARAILLTGLGDLGRWRDQLAQRLGLPVTVMDGAQPLGRGPLALAAPVSPVVVGGLACADEQQLLNLSPVEARQQLRHRRQVRVVARLSGLAAAAFVLAGAWLGVHVAREARLADQLAEALAQAEPEAKRIQEQHRSVEFIEAVLAERGRLLELLAGVFQRTPGAIALDGVALERARHELVIRGAADSTQTVLGYIAALKALPGVAGVELRYTTQRSSAAEERTAFELVMRQAAAGETAS